LSRERLARTAAQYPAAVTLPDDSIWAYQPREYMKKDPLYEQNDCLRRLGLHIADGAELIRGNDVIGDCKFYLFAKDGEGISVGYTMQELIANIPKGEK
jgi:hypothetical protein